MIQSIAEFAETWKFVSEGTQKMMDALTDKSLSQSVADGHRDLGRVAWHIVGTVPEMMNRTGLKFQGVSEADPVPTKAADIAAAYKSAATQLTEQITGNWKDETLQQEDEMYGMTWKRGLTLRILMNHEIHHRGQLTVLMRQAGLRVPGVFGPSKEEWAEHKMEEPAV